MQRYTLGDYKSVYRDPGSVPINTQLRQQFAQAFAADDALAGAVDQMQAADFAGDQEIKKRLEEQTRAELENRAARGNYESMGMDITKSARAFQKGYQPLTQNLAKVKAYQEKIEKDYRDGFIDINTRNAKLAMSTKDYQGLQMNEQGAVDESSYFKGRQYVEDVDISADFDKRMEGYIAEKYNKSRGGYEKVQLPGGAVEYHIETEKGLEIIDAQKVSRMFKDMIAGPKYQAAIKQQAEVNTYTLDDEAIQSRLLTALDGDSEDPDSKGLRQDLVDAKKEVENAKTKTKKAAAEEKVKTIESSISEMEAALETPGKTPEEMESIRRNFIEKSYADALVGREQQAVLDKYARVNVTADKYNVKYSEKEIADYNRLQEANLGSGMRINMDSIQTKNPGGSTLKDISTFNGKMVKAENGQVRAFKEAISNLDNSENYDLSQITADDIVNGTVPEELKTLPSYINAVKIINDSRASIKRQNELVEQAKEAVGYDDNQIESGLLKRSYSDVKADEILNFAREYYKDPDMTMTGVVNLLRSQREAAEEQNPGNVYQVPESIEFANALFNHLGRGHTEGSTLRDSRNGALINEILRKSRKVDEEAIGVVNDYLKEHANRTINYSAVDMAPGFTKKQQAESMKAFDNYFQGRDIGILDGMNLGYAGMAPDGTSTIAGFKETMSKDKRFTEEERKAWKGKITIDNVMFNESAGVDNGGITLEVKNEAGAIGRIYVPQSEFVEGGLSQYFYSPMFRLSAQVNKSKNMGLKTTTVDLKPGKDGVPMNLEFSFTSDGADNVKFTHGDDVMYIGTGSERFINLINDFEALGLLTF